MAINDFRFRAEGDLVVLQVEAAKRSYSGSWSDYEWRDAKVQDLLDVAHLIRMKGMTDKCVPSSSLEDFYK